MISGSASRRSRCCTAPSALTTAFAADGYPPPLNPNDEPPRHAHHRGEGREGRAVSAAGAARALAKVSARCLRSVFNIAEADVPSEAELKDDEVLVAIEAAPTLSATSACVLETTRMQCDPCLIATHVLLRRVVKHPA